LLIFLKKIKKTTVTRNESGSFLLNYFFSESTLASATESIVSVCASEVESIESINTFEVESIVSAVLSDEVLELHATTDKEIAKAKKPNLNKFFIIIF